MSNLTVMRPPRPADDIVSALRAIADDLENGQYGLMTTAVVVLGHTEEDYRTGEVGETIQVHGLGPRHDPFTVRGLLAAATATLGSTD